MFGNNCTECWDWLTNFLRLTFTDTSPDGLFKSLIVLTVIVIGLYVTFSMISHLTNVGANLVRKTLLPVTFITLVLLSLTVVAQFRKDKTCKFSIERYLTQCTPKKSEAGTNKAACPTGTSFSAACQQTQTDTTSSKKPKASWEPTTTTPTVHSWDATASPPKTKNSATKVLKTQSNKTTNVPKSCDSSQKPKTSDTAKQSDCDSPKNIKDEIDSSKAKERDYSKE